MSFRPPLHRTCLYVLFLAAILCLFRPALAAPPVCTAVDGDPDAFEGIIFSARFLCNDPDGDPITYSIHPSSPDAVVFADGHISWSPTAATVTAGTYRLWMRIQAGGETRNFFYDLDVWKTPIKGRHFNIFWRPTETTEAYARSILEYLETGATNSWDVETGDLDFKEPHCLSDEVRIPVFVTHLGYPGVTSRSVRTADQCRPSRIKIDTGMTVGLRQVTAAHEFFHAVQDRYSWHDRWWLDATAVWMEEQVFDGVNDYINYFFGPNSIQFNPQAHVTTTNIYAGCLFPIFLTEDTNDPDLVRDSFEEMADTPSGIIPILLENSFYGPDRFHRLWREFVLQNYIRRGIPDYEYDEGASFPRPMHLFRFPAMENLHYITELAVHGASFRAVANPPMAVAGTALDDAGFRSFSQNLPGLATMYIRVQAPVQLNRHRTTPSTAFLRFSGDAAALWSCDVIRIKRSGSFHPDIVRVVDHEKPERTGLIDFPIGGNDPDDTETFIIVVSNLDTDPAPHPFTLAGAMTPGFQSAYQSEIPAGLATDPATSTSPTVKNLEPGLDGNALGPDEDGLYRNGDTIRFEVDLTDAVHVGPGGPDPIPEASRCITADFSALDSHFDPARVEVREVDAVRHAYSIAYRISEDNGLFPDEESGYLAIPVAVTSLSRVHPEKDRNEDATYLIRLDNRPPRLERVTVTQEQAGEEVVVYDSVDQVRVPAIPPGTDAARLMVRLVFSEGMLTHEADGSPADPRVSIDTPSDAISFTPLGGWSHTNLDNDTWEGELIISRADLLVESPCHLDITARDTAGTPLDADAETPGPQPSTAHAFEWKTPGLARLIIKEDTGINYDSLEHIRREGSSGVYLFEAVFDEDMVSATLGFGPAAPYDKVSVELTPMPDDARRWQGLFELSDERFAEFQGAHRVSVTGTGVSGFGLDTDLSLEGSQPDTRHVFLIGAPRAWAATLQFREERTHAWNMRDDDVRRSGEEEAAYVTDFAIRFRESWSACGSPLDSLENSYSQRLLLIDEYASAMDSSSEEIARGLEQMALMREQFGDSGQGQEILGYLEKNLETHETTIAYSTETLNVLQGLHFYSPSYISVRSDGGHWGWLTHHDEGGEFSSRSDIRLVDCVHEVRDEPGERRIAHDPDFLTPHFSLVVNTLDEATYDHLVDQSPAFDEIGGFWNMMVAPIRLDCWKPTIHFAPPGSGTRYLTFQADLEGLYELVKRNGRWFGSVTSDYVGNDGYSYHQTDDIDQPMTQVTGGLPLSGDHGEEYPLYDYVSAFAPRGQDGVIDLETTPEIRRLGHFPFDGPSTDLSLALGLHTLAFPLTPENDSLWFEQTYEIRADGQLPMERGEETMHGVIEIRLSVEPLPEGDL